MKMSLQTFLTNRNEYMLPTYACHSLYVSEIYRYSVHVRFCAVTIFPYVHSDMQTLQNTKTTVYMFNTEEYGFKHNFIIQSAEEKPIDTEEYWLG